jgi:hypothetical protein
LVAEQPQAGVRLIRGGLHVSPFSRVGSSVNLSSITPFGRHLTSKPARIAFQIGNDVCGIG